MQFLVDNSIYVTLIIAVMILVGILLFVGRIDARVRRLERDVELESAAAPRR